MLEFIQSFAIFKHFTTEHKANLYRLLEKKEYRKGEYIIYEGEKDKSLFLIFSGSVRVTKKNDFGEDVEIVFMSRGTYFGEFSLIDNEPRSATVQAYEDTTCYLMSNLAYSELCRKYPEAEAAMLKGFLLDIVSRLRSTSESIINVSDGSFIGI
ncbi:MAG: cyclic nucleotide-binding domain-containing protein [Spirochaetota bacterium]|nr:cyclic nucleotide-binding domain-containing protein [Spirochaetota bacterium]